MEGEGNAVAGRAASRSDRAWTRARAGLISLAHVGCHRHPNDRQRRRALTTNIMCMATSVCAAVYVPIFATLGSPAMAWLCVGVVAFFAFVLIVAAQGHFVAARAAYFAGAAAIITVFAALCGPEAGIQQFVLLLCGLPFLFCDPRERGLLVYGVLVGLAPWVVLEGSGYESFGARVYSAETGRALYRVMFPTILLLMTVLIASFQVASDRAHDALDERLHDISVMNKQLADTLEELQRETSKNAQMEIELRFAQKLEAVGQLAAGIAHEINTPMQFVGDSVQFIRDAVDDLAVVVTKYRDLRIAVADHRQHARQVADLVELEDELELDNLQGELDGAFERAISGISRVSEIVRAMKEFSHPGSREMSPVDVNRTLTNALTVARHEYKYVATVELDLGEIPEVCGHGGDLHQVFINIIVNATHAIADRYPNRDQLGKISIRTSLRDETTVMVEISDTGTGIPDDIRQRIFDPFFTTKEVGRGTGQGLAIAHSVVADKHHGSLAVESTVGEGTTFLIGLPVKQPRGAETEQHQAA
ncbi:MAG: hypothetical protein B7733_11320 [Myxococcales bacterium FL481]|nr:MAG: hypothetical protein B7733_11320 [Myxococcales bacterium FL481]